MDGYFSSYYLLFLIPFLSILSLIYFYDCIPSKSKIYKAFHFAIEHNLNDLLIRNNFKKTNTFIFQIIRLVISAMIAFSILLIKGINLKGLVFIITFIIVYKGIYYYLLVLDSIRINKLNKELPYLIKSLSLLAYNYPVNTAIVKSIESIDSSFKNDLIILLQDIDNDPISFVPYQNFIDRYEGKLENLETYMKTLYRMSSSSKNEDEKILSNLTDSLLSDVGNARRQKNNSINLYISFLGLIPIVLLCFVLCYLMIQSISII